MRRREEKRREEKKREEKRREEKRREDMSYLLTVYPTELSELALYSQPFHHAGYEASKRATSVLQTC